MRVQSDCARAHTSISLYACVEHILRLHTWRAALINNAWIHRQTSRQIRCSLDAGPLRARMIMWQKSDFLCPRVCVPAPEILFRVAAAQIILSRARRTGMRQRLIRFDCCCRVFWAGRKFPSAAERFRGLRGTMRAKERETRAGGNLKT